MPYSIVDQTRLKVVTINNKTLRYDTEAEALQALRTLQSQKPQLAQRLRVIPATEIETL